MNGSETAAARGLSWEEAMSIFSKPAPRIVMFKHAVAGAMYSFVPGQFVIVAPDAPAEVQRMFDAWTRSETADGTTIARYVDSLPVGYDAATIGPTFRTTPPPAPPPPRMFETADLERRFGRPLAELQSLGFPKAKRIRVTEDDVTGTVYSPVWNENDVEHWARLYEERHAK